MAEMQFYQLLIQSYLHYTMYLKCCSFFSYWNKRFLNEAVCSHYISTVFPVRIDSPKWQQVFAGRSPVIGFNFSPGSPLPYLVNMPLGKEVDDEGCPEGLHQQWHESVREKGGSSGQRKIEKDRGTHIHVTYTDSRNTTLYGLNVTRE